MADQRPPSPFELLVAEREPPGQDGRVRPVYVAAAARRAVIARMWKQGASYASIAEALSPSPGMIQAEVRRMRADGWDLPDRPRGRRRKRDAKPDPMRDARWKEIARLWAQGVTAPMIAVALRTTPGAIKHEVARMRAAGWDLPRRPPGRTSSPSERHPRGSPF